MDERQINTNGQFSSALTRTLISRAQQGDEQAKEQLVTTNAPLVKSVAKRFMNRAIEYDDLYQIGCMGLIKAIARFDLSYDVRFSTYAVPMIAGEIKRFLRDDGMIKVGRGYKKLGMLLMRERNRIVSGEGREPGISELAAACGVSSEEAAVALDAMTPVSSLSDTVYGDEGATLESTVSDGTEELERLSDHIALTQSIAKMQPMWRRIIMLRYYRNMTQQQTADSLGLSQVKVSREEKKILAFLRTEMIT